MKSEASPNMQRQFFKLDPSMTWRNVFLFPSAITTDILLFFSILGRVEHAQVTVHHYNLTRIPYSQY